MEGRIGVAITVLLTLSTESAGSREHLPSVSYMKVWIASNFKCEQKFLNISLKLFFLFFKAIDLWFGFITAFVFTTLLQTIFVIAMDKRAKQLVS